MDDDRISKLDLCIDLSWLDDEYDQESKYSYRLGQSSSKNWDCISVFRKQCCKPLSIPLSNRTYRIVKDEDLDDPEEEEKMDCYANKLDLKIDLSWLEDD